MAGRLAEVSDFWNAYKIRVVRRMSSDNNNNSYGMGRAATED